MKRRIMIAAALLFLIIGSGMLLADRFTVSIGENRPLCADSLGMMLEDGSDGLTVTAVRRHSPADRAGFTPGDLLQAMNDTPVTVVSQLDELLSGVLPPCKLRCLVQHNGEAHTLLIHMKH